MHPILTVRDQERFWKELLTFLKADKLVPIVGPELLDIPVGGGRSENFYTLVARDLAERVEVGPTARHGMAAVNEIVGRYVRDHRGDDAASQVRAAIDSVEHRQSLRHSLPPALLAVANLPARLFVSTTCDDLLSCAIEKQQPEWEGKVEQVHYSPKRPERFEPRRDGPPAVFHLFGRAASMDEDYAVSDDDVLEYMLALQSSNRSPEALLRYLRGKNLLFLGCGFPDWLARFFIRLGRDDRFSSSSSKTDWLVDSTSSDRGFVAFLEHFSRNLRCFPHPPLAFVDELRRHVPEEALRTLRRGARPPVPERDTHRDILPGSVFVSYASEDRTHAERIRHALDQSGVDCWFDRQQLMGGDDWEVKIRGNVRACRVFMPLLSRTTTVHESRFFRHEWDEAIAHRPGRRPDARFLLPVCLDGFSIRDPSVPQEFQALEALQLSLEGTVEPSFIEAVKRAYRQAELQHVSGTAP